MTSITQTIEITEDHKLQLNLQLPSDLPNGETEMVITFRPKASSCQDNFTARLRELVPPEVVGTVKINGDLLEPIDVEWEAQR